ncbi:uncharacterized protein VTP21DRAFT_307 [Calcarisporiella thermophila]|uniref:uncharacterized protein n=1 Tax=Calcarisporiella thermophila TaxID=911321 RepID=UPI0037441244
MAKIIGELVVVALKAKNLPNREIIGKQDPYCTFRIGTNVQRTKTDKRGGQKPEWDDQVNFKLNEGETKLFVQVLDEDRNKSDLIGEANIDFSRVLKEGELDDWFKLEYNGRYAGEIYIEFTFYSSSAPPPPTVAPTPPPVPHELKVQGGQVKPLPTPPLPQRPIATGKPSQPSHQYGNQANYQRPPGHSPSPSQQQQQRPPASAPASYLPPPSQRPNYPITSPPQNSNLQPRPPSSQQGYPHPAYPPPSPHQSPYPPATYPLSSSAHPAPSPAPSYNTYPPTPVTGGYSPQPRPSTPVPTPSLLTQPHRPLSGEYPQPYSPQPQAYPPPSSQMPYPPSTNGPVHFPVPNSGHGGISFPEPGSSGMYPPQPHGGGIYPNDPHWNAAPSPAGFHMPAPYSSGPSPAPYSPAPAPAPYTPPQPSSGYSTRYHGPPPARVPRRKLSKTEL